MRVIPPITIDDSVLLSSTVAEPTVGIDPGVWGSSASYVEGDRAVVLSTHKIYECLTNVTGGDSPNNSITRAVPKWVEVGSTNKWAMFDLYRNTPTISATTEMTVIIQANLTIDTSEGYLDLAPISTTAISVIPIGGMFFEHTPSSSSIGPDTVALLNLVNISSVRIKAVSVSDSITRYDETFVLTNRVTTTWYTYFYGSYNLQTDLIVYDLPINSYGELRIEIILNGSEGMSIGSCVLGVNTIIGNIQRGSIVDTINASIMERDTFGNAYLVPQSSVTKTSQKITVDKNKLDTLVQLKRELNAIPALWVGIEDTEDPYFSAMLVLGFYREFSFSINNPILVDILLELEGI